MIPFLHIKILRLEASSWKWWTYLINSSWPSDAIWWHRSGSTLVQVMACCLTAPSHYLNQCWVVSKVQWHSFDGNFTRYASASDHWVQFENYLCNLSFEYARGQWVNTVILMAMQGIGPLAAMILTKSVQTVLASIPWNKQRVLMHGHQGWNVRHGLCHIYMRYIYIYIWVVYSLCFFCCLFITVTWWYVWCIEWASGNQEEV